MHRNHEQSVRATAHRTTAAITAHRTCATQTEAAGMFHYTNSHRTRTQHFADLKIEKASGQTVNADDVVVKKNLTRKKANTIQELEQLHCSISSKASWHAVDMLRAVWSPGRLWLESQWRVTLSEYHCSQSAMQYVQECTTPKTQKA